jgi:hypothetical protein
MTWARLDDTFHHHPKLMRVDLAAVGLFALGLSYAADNLTDGHLPERWVRGRTIGDSESAVDQLVRARLWERTEDGFLIHDFGVYNLTRGQVEAQIEQRRAAGLASAKVRGSLPERPVERVVERPVDEPMDEGSNDPLGARSTKPEGEGGTLGGEGMSGSGSGNPLANGSGTSPSTSRSVARARGGEFDDWIEHYREATGRTEVRGSKAARQAFGARRQEGFSVEELKLATVGSHGDAFCREHGHDVPETILRASKVQRYIVLGRDAAPSKPREAVH